MSLRSIVGPRRTFPYVNARVRAMRGNLLSDADYRKLRKMELSEMAEFLAEHGYRAEIDALGTEYSGAALLERALHRHLAATERKLERIAPEPVAAMLRQYYRKFDVDNLKTVFRALARGAEDVDLDGMLLPTREIGRDQLDALLAAGTIEEAVEMIPDAGLRRALQAADLSDRRAVEDALDRAYYTSLLDAADQLPVDSDLFRRFLQLEAALTNVETILRLHRAGADAASIRDRLIPVPRRDQVVAEDRLVAAESGDAALELLRDSPVGPYLDDGSAADVGSALQRYKLERGITMLHTDQLSVNPVLGFMICTEIEVANLRLLVRAEAEELPAAFVDRHLVTGVVR